ncbi:putative phosphothreonine lyase domain-containg protein [Neorhizobium sp. T6_25]|uniref:putative phosphothreonine lyase domain-containing protein n=1 Tax=Neorhizobium sp. T6_25 TaxID=2093833 RepID=UPI000CF924BE|nr:putative phosphothreonine lyase domain-containg protein [Neorhizobium sp. T6_25]
MLWFPTLSRNDFRSVIADSDQQSTGKWLVPIFVPDIGRVWEELEDAAVEGRLLAAKKSTPHLRKQIGHELVCVYCRSSDVDAVTETLAVLREIGITDELLYKSDRATADGRDEYLYSSDDFESPALKPS